MPIALNLGGYSRVKDNVVQIGELARRSGYSRDTLRFYEKRGLIRPIRRPNGYRHYPDEIVGLLDYVRTAQSLGFTLAEIEDEMHHLGADGLSQEKVAALLRAKLEMIDGRIAGLEKLRQTLAGQLEKACPVAARKR
jgi:DNA-binding transcriptional MerR regulator